MNLIPKTIPFTAINNQLLNDKKLKLQVARFDEIHPVVSGNKLFKLLFFLQKAVSLNCKTIVTIGGAYSNHLVATAYACKQQNLQAVAVVRGEEVVNNLSDTLQQCQHLGMKLFFVERNTFSHLDKKTTATIVDLPPADFIYIPEGGYAPLGAKGAATMMDYLEPQNPTHIILPVGTATTLAGLVSRKLDSVKIIAVPVLKNLQDVPERLKHLIVDENFTEPEIWPDYHFGGYAKNNAELISFMNLLYKEQQLPTDFVYTAKMMFGIFDKIQNNYFEKGSNIIAIHTGGLQGNRSFPTGTLHF